MKPGSLLHRIFFGPKIQVRVAWFLLVAAVIGWPVTALTVASGEPQFVLGLSWLSLILTAHNTLLTVYKQ